MYNHYHKVELWGVIHDVERFETLEDSRLRGYIRCNQGYHNGDNESEKVDIPFIAVGMDFNWEGQEVEGCAFGSLEVNDLGLYLKVQRFDGMTLWK